MIATPTPECRRGRPSRRPPTRSIPGGWVSASTAGCGGPVTAGLPAVKVSSRSTNSTPGRRVSAAAC